jgi:FOG: WD40 repeat
MNKFVCVLVVLAALLAVFACVSGSSSRKKHELDVKEISQVEAKVAIFPQLGHTDIVNSVAFSPNGKTIVSCSKDTTLKLWDTETGREIKTFNGHTHPVIDAIFSPDGKYIYSGSKDGTLKLWDVESGKEIRTSSEHSGSVTSVAFSPDGQNILLSFFDGSFKIVDVGTGDEIRKFLNIKQIFLLPLLLFQRANAFAVFCVFGKGFFLRFLARNFPLAG